ncbi:efflux RND transporter periplasmic adaptor subunit [Pontibacter sp. BAB1700]|uniref:efflux RND transporter periplasmic adaptor subunit n=1 Tax=Pontibacter sp. BAB1700 TaxID=1144253 RepID=UPI0002FEB62B|nr:efflux RND transporter periplasmic adaptor subunit [Pontibacter sp. BAB1700]
MKMLLTRRSLIAWSGLLFCAACTSAPASDQTAALPDTASTAAEATAAPTEVQVLTATLKTFEYHLQANGKIEPLHQSVLQFRQGGYLQQLHVKNGQYVRQGQLIASLEKDALQLVLKKAQSSTALKQEAYNALLVDYGGSFGQPESIDQGQSERLIIRSGLREAQLQQQEAALALAHTELRAPFSGRIADLNIKASNIVSATDPICMLYSANQLLLTAEVLESEALRLQLNQKAHIHTLANGGKQYIASVHEINPSVSAEGMVQVKLLVQQPQGLLPGMNTVASIRVPVQKAIVVPKDAVVLRSGKKVVFVAHEGMAVWRYVTTGLENEQEVEVLEGLKTGDQVIVANNLQLEHDTPVQVKQQLTVTPL